MNSDEITGLLAGLDGVLVLKPHPGDGSPEISWGDTFFYYAPDGVVPKTGQPFATIVTKNYPGEESRLDRPGAFRLNIAAGKAAFTPWTSDPSAVDSVIAHPAYGDLHWLAVVNPGPRTETAVQDLLHTAYDLARARARRSDCR